ncbi:uncharacterized protein EV422DRAFT_503737 [Fimicolochytrium jonesii]|uniref:uncharacterized protein n=1 Tax=Fimicolochytrium jonesii TaxID=1396493 RepID=UPI0022FE7B51|nr:uncharacterized protein EV422DRAFT_503737 [Fimicolochytrium jonesii]KAI8824955.1 hypothetical protein EV422DRAFT_503737 [Fimicolochytrium jonesii]
MSTSPSQHTAKIEATTLDNPRDEPPTDIPRPDIPLPDESSSEPTPPPRTTPPEGRPSSTPMADTSRTGPSDAADPRPTKTVSDPSDTPPPKPSTTKRESQSSPQATSTDEPPATPSQSGSPPPSRPPTSSPEPPTSALPPSTTDLPPPESTRPTANPSPPLTSAPPANTPIQNAPARTIPRTVVVTIDDTSGPKPVRRTVSTVVWVDATDTPGALSTSLPAAAAIPTTDPANFSPTDDRPFTQRPGGIISITMIAVILVVALFFLGKLILVRHDKYSILSRKTRRKSKMDQLRNSTLPPPPGALSTRPLSPGGVPGIHVEEICIDADGSTKYSPTPSPSISPLPHPIDEILPGEGRPLAASFPRLIPSVAHPRGNRFSSTSLAAYYDPTQWALPEHTTVVVSSPNPHHSFIAVIEPPPEESGVEYGAYEQGQEQEAQRLLRQPTYEPGRRLSVTNSVRSDTNKT